HTGGDFSNADIRSIERLVFGLDYSNNGATFKANQVGNGRLASNLAVTGWSDFADALVINMSDSTSLDLSAFTFANWTAGTDTFTIHGDADPESVTGTTQIDSIYGNWGTDTLVGGAGFDQLFGGEGNDRIVWDAGDDLANVLGGSEIDTLVISGGNAPVTFGLTAHEFERAEHSFGIGGGASQRDVYNADWQRTERTIWEADGRYSVTRFDPTDAEDWAQIDDNYAVGNVYASQTGYNDDGSRWSATFNISGASDYIYNYYDALNRLDYTNGRFDDGRTFLEDNDQTDTNNSVSSGAGDWSTKYAVNDANGLADYQYDYYDDGTRSYLEHDQNNETTEYRYQYTFYDANGVADYLQGVRDNGDAYFINL
ncbi:MAG: hypothetical protein HOO99_08700, partial [Hyphomicrobiaceae bacterium]|nr:hypothetical protein [Hyphomicrobiaceae bacterium]